VIVNAGIAHVAPLTELGLDTFRKLESVNVEGTLLVLAEAGRHFALQGTGGDVVLVSTKNVFAPGAGFGAYSATKAAAHQLARIASLEFAPLGVRVNMVAPDAVFSHGQKRSGLWAAVGPNRMKARGLDERGLEEYYRSRNLLKAAGDRRTRGTAPCFSSSRTKPPPPARPFPSTVACPTRRRGSQLSHRRVRQPLPELGERRHLEGRLRQRQWPRARAFRALV
jgi:NAD(P)-dependent dehydrogenase (short-subunit alcohol dehydrogenase family)